MKKLIVANWKCNPTSLREARKLFASLKRELVSPQKTEVVICPPFVYLAEATDFFRRCGKSQSLKLGSQNCFWQKKGAFTGEVSALMLKDLGVKYVIVGHSERRQMLGETDEMVNRKLRYVLKASQRPILCVGETQQERERGKAFKIIESQIREDLEGLAKKQIEKVVVAYEPIWAIGTGKACNTQEAETCILFIRKIIAKIFSKKAATNLPILYGGSVNSENALDYLQSPHINGLLVGGASLDPKEFIKIAQST